MRRTLGTLVALALAVAAAGCTVESETTNPLEPSPFLPAKPIVTLPPGWREPTSAEGQVTMEQHEAGFEEILSSWSWLG